MDVLIGSLRQASHDVPATIVQSLENADVDMDFVKLATR